ncbi:MAG TPA: outer membrane lipoprotein chaperone LolA [Candidatus Binataceae bacterium]|nr:outer membrane lipoprotein chaperone LolA [Candidatus Binataceae bacterium]
MHHQRFTTVAAAIVAIAVAVSGSAIAETSVFADHAKPSSANLDATLDALQHHYETTRSFSAKFTERIAAVGAPVRTREGTVAFSKPGRMRWDFETPNKELLVSNGQTVFSYDPGLNQVVETPLKDALRAPGATEFLLGAGNIRKEFIASASKSAPADGLTYLRLTPRQGGNTIDLGIDPKSGDIRRLMITDQLGNKTSLEFSDVRDNVEITDSEFEFTAPAGADIVSPTLPR